MNLDDKLKEMGKSNIKWRYAEYFKWKHEVRYDQTLEKKSTERFLRYVERKTLNPFLQWERTNEYKQLLTLLLESKLADDMEEIYKIVTKNAKKGDEKAVKLFMSLQKEIISNAKLARESLGLEEDNKQSKKSKGKVKQEDDDDTDDSDEYDDLIVS